MKNSIMTDINQYTKLSNTKILNIVSTRVSNPTINDNRERVVIDNLTVENCVTSDWLVCLNISGRGDFIVRNSRFLNNSRYGNDSFGINGMGQIAPFPDIVDRLRIEISNCEWSGNTQEYNGPMSRFHTVNDTLFITNCTFANNTGGSAATHITGNAVLTNNIFWNPGLGTEVGIPYYTDLGPSHVRFRHNNIRNGINGIWNSTALNQIIYEDNNTSFNPEFIGTGLHPYYLSSTSPLIDAGTPDTTGLYLPLYDVGGNERLWDGNGDGIARIDIGAYEYQPMNSPQDLTAEVSLNTVHLNWSMPAVFLNRSLAGYRVYRDSVAIADISNPEMLDYIDQITESDTLSYWVVALYGEIETAPSNAVTVYVEYVPTADETAPALTSFRVYPNPFRDKLTVRYSLSKPSEVKLEIYNLKGQRVRLLYQAHKAAGEHSVIWDAIDEGGVQCANGIYLLKVRVGKALIGTYKLTLIK